MTTMRAAVYHGTRDIRIEEIGVPEPGPGELLLEVHAAGICGTDASEWDHGPMMFPVSVRNEWSGHDGPMVPGHEFGGRVVDRGPGVGGFPDGTLVASGAGVSCGSCGPCRAAITNFCERYFTVGLQRHGALARYVDVPAGICLDVGELGLGDDRAALVQPMSIALHSLRQGRPGSGDSVVVIGVGGVGAFLVYAAVRSGLRVLAADLDPERLQVAAGLGASLTLEVDRDRSLALQIRDAMRGSPAVVYEVTGVPSVLTAALDVVAPRGRVVAIGLGTVPVPVDVRSLTLRELHLVGTNAHVFAADFQDAARLVADRAEGWSDVAPVALPLDLLVTDGLLPMVERRPEQIKTLIDPWAPVVRRAARAGLSGLHSVSLPSGSPT